MKFRIAAFAGMLLLVLLVWLCLRIHRSDIESGKPKGDTPPAFGNDTKAGPKDGVERSLISWGEEVKGYRIALVFPKTVFSITESVPCRVLGRQVDKQTRLPGAVETRVFLGSISVSPDNAGNLNTNLRMNWHDRTPRYMGMKESGAVCGLRIADLTRFCDLTLEGRYYIKMCAYVEEEAAAEPGKEGLLHSMESKPMQIEIRNFADYPLVERPRDLAAGQLNLPADWSQCKRADGVAVAVAFGRERFSRLDPVSCDLSLKNVGDSPHPLPYGQSITPSFELELTEIYLKEGCVAGTRAAERTARGRKLLEAGARGSDHVVTRIYRPNEGYTLTICALNRFFDMTGYGTYELRATAILPELATGRLIKVTSDGARTKVQWGQALRNLEDDEIEELLKEQEKPK